MIKLSRKKATQEYFSSETNRWDEVYKEGDSSFNYEMQKRKEIVFELIKKNIGFGEQKAIDVGCGAGHYVKEMINLGFDTMGSDISKGMIECTRSNLGIDKDKTPNLLCADCEFTPFPDHYFDLVICIGVLSYVNDEIRILQELKRIVKNDGTVIVSFPNLIKMRNITDPYYYLIRIWEYIFHLTLKDHKEKKVSDNFEAQNRYLLKQIYKYANKSSFIVSEIQGYFYFNPTFWRKQILSHKNVVKVNNYIVTKLKKKSYKLLLNFPYGWVVSLRPK